MDWKHLLAYITGSVDQELLRRNEYLVTENRILRQQIRGRIRLNDGERKTLAKIGRKLGKKALAEVATIVKPDTILAWHRKLVAQKFDGSQHRRSPGRPMIDEELEALVVRIAPGELARPTLGVILTNFLSFGLTSLGEKPVSNILTLRDHQAYLFDTFQYRAPLFNEVCHGRAKPLLDVWEAVPTWETDLQTARNYAFQVMEYIWASIPCLLQNLGTYLKVERVE